LSPALGLLCVSTELGGCICLQKRFVNFWIILNC
jgi:hypothetical protein